MVVTATAGVTVEADLLVAVVRLPLAAAHATILLGRTTVVTETVIATMIVNAVIPATVLVPRILGTNPRLAHPRSLLSRSLHPYLVTAIVMTETTATAVITALTVMIVKVSFIAASVERLLTNIGSSCRQSSSSTRRLGRC